MKIILYVIAAIRAILVFGGMAVFILGYGLTCIFQKHTKSRALKLRENFLRYWCIPLFNIKIDIQGQHISKPALYVSNHRSFTDPIVICRYLPAFVIAKAEVADYPIINKGAELTGVIWVDRQNKDSRAATRDMMVETIQSGFNILVFPEGTVGTDKHTLPFRKGTFMEAAENNIPIVPIAIEYQSPKDLWILQKFLPQFFYQFSKWSTHVKIRFGQPLDFSNGDEGHEFASQWINTQLSEMQLNWSTAF